MARPTTSRAPAEGPSAAEALLDRARRAADRGRPAEAVDLCRRALGAVANTDAPATLRSRLIITLSYNLSELGRTAEALRLLDGEFAQADPDQQPALRASRGLILSRTGDTARALDELDVAVRLLRAGGGHDDLARTLLNRGLLRMNRGELSQAERDTTEAETQAEAAGSDVVVFMARYNLGYIKYLAGDLPGALDAMAAAEKLAPEAALGVPALDRARVLLAAGLIGEARDFCAGAIATFTANRAGADLVEALLVGADIAVMSDDPAGARAKARTAARTSARRGDVSTALLAELAGHRASAVLRRTGTATGPPDGSRRRRAGGDALASIDLADRLAARGLPQDATAALLLGAEAMLAAADTDGAADLYGRVDTRRSAMGTRLQARLVGARIEMARGRRAHGLILLRRGLDELAGFQALFGSQDLQAAAAVWGRELSREGLRAAVGTGAPGAILQWLERARATTTRLPHIRPPADPDLAADLGALRVAQGAARAAVLAGRPDRDREREVEEIRRRIRARSWTIGGTGTALRPPSLASVRRALAASSGPGQRGVVLAYFYGAGGVHLLRVDPTGASYHRLGDFDAFEAMTRRAAADLELLSSDRVPDAIRMVAGRSLDATLRRMSELLVEPVLDPSSGPVLVSGIGPLAVVPWAMLPALVGRAVSVTHSVTASLSGLPARVAAAGGVSAAAAPRGVLAVAGPDLSRAEEEVRAVGAHHPGAVALGGSDATGAAVLDRMPGGGLLHVAAHGHHESENPLFSSVLLADGPLFAYDIAPVPVLPEQIVLSSCDVGRIGMRADAEPLGLAVALLRSGVRTVIAAVAPVSDRAAATVMDAYHRRLAAGAGPARALADSLSEAGDRPAPFTCFGAGE